MRTIFSRWSLFLIGIILVALLATKASTALRSPGEPSNKASSQASLQGASAADESKNNTRAREENHSTDSSAQSGSPAAPVESLAPSQGEPDSRISAEVLSEIMKIRRSQNGLLQGTPLESPGSLLEKEDDFVQALKKIAGQAEAPPKAGFSKPSRKGSILAPSDMELRSTPANDYEFQRGEPPGSEDEKLAGMLRWTSRQLDQKANHLEESKSFQRADELRNLSQRMRLEARRFEQIKPLRQARNIDN